MTALPWKADILLCLGGVSSVPGAEVVLAREQTFFVDAEVILH